MNRERRCSFALLALAAAAWALPMADAGERALSFVDEAPAWGLAKPLAGIMAHAAACGDFDGDGDLDLYVGGFCDRPPEQYKGASGPVPNILLVNDGGRFRDSGQKAVVFMARTSGAVFADLDNDGDLDLYVSNNSKPRGLRVPNKLYENVGGVFRDCSEGNAACTLMGGRSIGVLDFDGDGLLDLLVASDQPAVAATRLFRNRGGLAFEDATAKAGLPTNLVGFGVAIADLNGDGWPDFFVSNANRLFLSKGDGTYREAGSDAFRHTPINNEDTPCGVAFGDLDRDGDLDLLVVDHAQPAHQHLFLNGGPRDGGRIAGNPPQFREATREAGLAYEFPSWTPDRLHLKHAHAEIADFDNDGWPDILVAATWDDGGTNQPFVCRNLGVHDGRARFAVPPAANANAYFADGPIADFDHDGRLDMFFAAWVPGAASPLFLNRSPVRHWLQVAFVGRTINRMGIGVQVRVYEAGKTGQGAALLGDQEIGVSQGFCTGQEAVVHFGLGDAERCDLELALPFGKGTIRRAGVTADQRLTVREP